MPHLMGNGPYGSRGGESRAMWLSVMADDPRSGRAAGLVFVRCHVEAGQIGAPVVVGEAG